MLPTAGGEYYLGERGYGGVLLLQLDVFGNGKMGAIIYQQDDRFAIIQLPTARNGNVAAAANMLDPSRQAVQHQLAIVVQAWCNGGGGGR